MMNDYKLDEYCQSIAEDIFNDMLKYDKDEDWARDQVMEQADGTEYTIYYYKAHELCQNCNIENGEAWAEDCGMTPKTYDEWATTLAYGEISTRVSIALEQLIEDYENETENQES